MNEALSEYILMKRPEVKRSLQKQARGMTDEQQAQFLAAMQLGDTEFQAELAPYMPEESAIDPSKAALIPLPLEDRERGYGLKGISRKGTNRPLRMDTPGGGEIEIPGNRVSVLGAINANPQVWSHEYRHQEDSDAFNETNNRILDVFASRTKKDFKEAVGSLADAALYEARQKADASGDEEKTESHKNTEEAYYKSNSKDPTIDDLDSALDDLLFNDPYIKEQFESVKRLISFGKIKQPGIGPQYERFVSGKKERNAEKQRKQKIKDEGYEGAGYLPIDFKEGGRSKLI
jgi:hypothetical protein